MAEHAPVTLSIIAAMDRNRLIGVGGVRMPWHLPADLQHFKRTTMGRPLIMGRRTHDSIGRVLPGRLNIVLTRGQGITPVAGQLDTARSLDDAIAQATAWLDDRPLAPREVCVIGGAEVYAQALPRADRLVITEIDAEFEGDVYFPDAIGDRAAWAEATREHHPAGEPSGVGFDFVTYRRSDGADRTA
jgi:dihydrofolate reductase